MRRRFIASALWLCAATLLVACSDPAPRAVVIGIDGADWRVIDPLVAEGRMPHLAALRERGTSGPIQTLAELPISPVVWTSVATGKVPSKHGVTWFLVDQPDGTRVPVRSHNRQVKALWNVLAERKKTPIVLGWWATYPAEDVGAGGVVVSDALGFHGFGRSARAGDAKGKTHPADLFAEMDALVPPEQQLSPEFAARFMDLPEGEFRKRRFDPAQQAQADPTNPVHLFQQYAVTAQGYTAMAESLLARPYDLFLVYFEQVDSLSHLFMKHAPPKLEWVHPEEFDRYKDVVSEWYVYQDELLGRLLAKIDLDTTAVFVMSDHGFKSGERRIRSEQAVDLRTAHLDHEPDGIFLAAGPHIRRGAKVDGASVLDVAPTVLHYLGLPVAKDMDGAVLESIFEPAFASAHPLQYVASYETGEPAAKPAVAEEGGDEAELAANVAALETLGYVQKPGDGGEAGPSSPEIHNNLGRTLANAGKLDEAEAEFAKALELNPNDADALLNLATVAALRGNPARAEHLAKQALRANPDHTIALAKLAELRRDAGDLDEAQRLFREALAIDEVSPELYLGLGDVLQRAGKFEDAEAAFRRVLELDPDSFAAYYNLGVTALQQQQYDASIAAFEKALALNAEHPLAAAAHNNIGTVQLDRGDRAKAIAAFEQAANKPPPIFEARFNLGSLYLEDGRLDDAIRIFEDGAALSPNHEALNARLARAYMQKGRGEDAYRTLTLLQRLYPRNWYAPLGLAALHAANGRPGVAKPLLAQALELGGDAARQESASYPALAPLLASGPKGAAPAR